MEFITLIIIAIIALLFFSIFTVPQQRVAVLQRFGKFLRLADSGLNIRIPFIDHIAGVIDLRIQQLDVVVETKTKDNVFVHILVSVQYKVIDSKIYEAFYSLANSSQQIQSYVFDVVRAKVPSIDLDDLFSKKDEIAVNVQNELKDTMERFGFQIVKALVTDIQPDENVKRAMNEINTAQRIRVATYEKAEAEKIVRVKQAEAQAEANILHGKGIAGQREAIIEGLGKSIEEIASKYPNFDSASILQTILTIQYFDTLKEIGASSKTNTIFVEHTPNAVSNVYEQLIKANVAINKDEEK